MPTSNLIARTTCLALRPGPSANRSVLRRWVAWTRLAGLVLLLLATSAARAADDFLDPIQAFPLSVRVEGDATLVLRFDVAPGYYLYREPFAFTAPPAVSLGVASIPAGERKYDENFAKTVEVYHRPLEVRLPVNAGGGEFDLTVRNQGCADKGLCYPPTERVVRVSLKAFGGNGTAQVLDTLEEGAAAGRSGLSRTGELLRPPRPLDDPVARVLESGRLLSIAGVFFVAGLLLSFTPCVLPMVPILSSIVVGHGRGAAGSASRGRGLWLAAAYALGMACVYTALGVAAGLAGEGLAAALQTPIVLAVFAAILVVLSASMFGLYELQLPARLQTRLSAGAQSLPGGRTVAVFLMGGVSALIVSPCVAAPLAGALLYISQTRDVWLGGSALFMMACGMSVPLLLVGASAETWLPRAGAWMNHVKHLFGFALLAVALWTVQPLLSVPIAMAAWGGLGLALALFAWRITMAAERGRHSRLAWGGVSIVALVLGGLQWLGAVTGAHDPLAPLSGLRAERAVAGVTFERVKTLAEFEQRLATAGRPVVLDFYADWCVSCKEMERFTFSDPQVAERMGRALLLQVDVTGNTDDDRALLKRFRLFGPPGLLFFDAKGNEGLRVIGYQDVHRFRRSLSDAGL